MINLDKLGLDSFIPSFNDENEFYSINYEFIDFPIDPHVEFEKTSSVMCRALLSVTNKVNKETISFPVDLMQVPLITSMGLKIDGTFYEVCPINSRANGWYNLKDKKGVITLELVPTTGRSIKFTENKGIISVTLGARAKDVPLGVYLKAVSGLSYKELIKKIGFKNPFISRSLVNEVSYEECVDIVLNKLIPKNHNDIGYEQFPKEIRSKEVKKRLGPSYIKLSPSSIERYRKTTSFLNRCLGLELDRTVEGIPAGKKLTVQDLTKLDSSDVTTIYVNKDNKCYEIKKYKINDGEYLSIDEICTELNVYINNLCGFEYYDNMFDDLNREILVFDEAIKREIGNRLTSINEYLNSILIRPNLNLGDLNIKYLNKYDFYSFINKCKSEFRHSQSAETTNGLSFIGQRSKVIIDYSGNTNEDIIGIKSSHQSAYDLLHIPESLKVGLVNHMTMSSVVSDRGDILSPYLKVSNGLIQSREPVYLSPSDRMNRIIAPWDAKLDKERVKCYYNGRVITVPREDIEFIEFSVFQTISVASALIPFAQFSDGKRVVMGCSQNKQSVPCLGSEAPLVSTGALSFDKNASELVIRAINILNNIYISNKLMNKQNVDYDLFLQGTIRLSHIDNSKVGYRGYMFETTYDGQLYSDVVVVPFAKKGSNDTMFHFFLNYKPGMEFKGSDIVLYNNSIDIKKYDLVKHINLGSESLSEDVLFDFDTCLGANYLVAYKTSGLANMDDGICVSDEILGTGMLSHVKIVEFKEELKNFKKGVKEYFGIDHETKTHTENGLPKIGITLKPRSNVIGKTVIKDNIKTIKYSQLEMDREGEVIYAEIVGNEAIVGIATIADAEVGDKLAGDHGNKGVIGRIIPAKDMPFMEDGTKVQITLNPLGVPSRMNFAQFYVALLGYSMKLQGKRMILSSFNPDSYEIAAEYLKDPRLSAQQLYDGRTCLPFDRTTTIGYIYLKKQTHTARSKVNSCANPNAFNVITNQPNKGKAISGGQKTGEMETWTLEALGCRNFLQELFTIKSDYVQGRKELVNCISKGELYEGPMIGSNIHAVQTFLRMSGCDLVLKDGKYVVQLMTEDDIRGLSVSPLKNTKEALQDSNVFGSMNNPNDIDRVKKKWSYLDLGVKIIHPTWIYKSDVPNLIIYTERKLVDGVVESKINRLSSEKLKSVISGKYFLEFKDNGKILGSSDANLLDSPSSGIGAVVTAFEYTDLIKTREFYEKQKQKILNSRDAHTNINKQQSVYKIDVLLNTLDFVSNYGNDLSVFVISTFPVMPKNYRYQIDGRLSDFDIFYSRIISAILSGDADKVYARVLEFVGLDNKAKLSKDQKAKNLAEYFSGKNSDKHHGAIRESIISHTVSFSGRSVIVPGNIKLGYVGLPRQACYNLKRLEIKNKMMQYPVFYENEDVLDQFIVGMEMGDVNRCISCMQNNMPIERETVIRLIEDCDSMMRELLQNSAVAIGRQPTLHEGSIRGLVPMMVEGHSIHIHTLLCPAFNADFDGDQMWYAMAHTKASTEELLSKAHPSNGVFSSKNGEVNLSPTQDVILGIYLATMLHENVLDGSSNDKYSIDNVQYFNSIEQIKSCLDFGLLNSKDLVCYLHSNGNKYLSTAGRILMNSIFRYGFTDEEFTNNMNLKFVNPSNYKNLKYDGLVKSEAPVRLEEMEHFTTIDREGNEVSKPFVTYGINNIITEEVRGLDPDSILEFFDSIVEFGIESCIKSGITLHLDDFKDSKIKDAYAEKYEKLIGEWNEYYDLGLMTEEERKSLSIRAANYCADRVKKNIMDDYERNDNLFIIIDSGARGKAAQVMRSTGLIGIVNKTNTEQMETPIMTGYKYGLDSSSVFIMANGTRNGVAAVQKDTGKTGEMTRDTVYMSAGLRVVESDCGCGFIDIDVDYSEPMYNDLSLANCKLKPGTKLFDDTKFLTRDGIINTDVINYIHKNHITEVQLIDDSIYTIKYKVSSLFRNMMINKLGTDLEYLDRGQIITDKTIDFIEANQLKSIKSRTILKCESKDGICSRCYGVLHNGRKLPPIGYAAGVIAGQSIGEPSTQLMLDQINAGGAGNNSASAIDICKAIIAGSDTDRFKHAIVSDREMHVVIDDAGKECILDMMDVKYKVPKSDLLVVDGEKVHPGQILSRGVVNVQTIPSSIDDFLYVRMFRQLETLFYLFYNSNVSVDARHFEVMVKTQLDYVNVYYSDCPEIKEGLIYPYSEVKEKLKEGYIINFYNKPLKKLDRILTVSGTTTALCHHDPFKTIAKIGVNPSIQNDKVSFIGALLTGSNVANIDGELNKPIPPKFMYTSTNSYSEENSNDERVVTNLFEVEEQEVPLVNVDINAILEESLDFNDLLESISNNEDVSPELGKDVLDNIKSSSFFSDDVQPSVTPVQKYDLGEFEDELDIENSYHSVEKDNFDFESSSSFESVALDSSIDNDDDDDELEIADIDFLEDIDDDDELIINDFSDDDDDDELMISI